MNGNWWFWMLNVECLSLLIGWVIFVVEIIVVILIIVLMWILVNWFVEIEVVSKVVNVYCIMMYVVVFKKF